MKPARNRAIQLAMQIYELVTADSSSAVSKLSMNRWQNVASQNVHSIVLTSVPSRKIAEAWLRAR